MYKYLDLKGEEFWLFLEEYFGVVLVFVVFGVLIYNINKMDNEMNIIDFYFQRVVFEFMLLKIMGWLYKIVQDVLYL